MAPSKNRGKSLSRALDQDVLQLVRKYIDELEEGSRYPSSSVVYDWIQRSNSSLKRRPKAQISPSIEWALEVLREDSSNESFDEQIDMPQETKSDHSTANIMNRSIISGWNTASTASTPVVEGRSTGSVQRQTNGEPSKKRRKLPLPGEVPQESMPVSDVRLDDLGGIDPVLVMMKDHVIFPLLFWDRIAARRMRISRGILLHGPPGCGKTMMCKALANELELPFIQILGPSIVSGMSGESEKQVRDLFAEARRKAPALIFIDEIDAIAPKRDTSQSQMEKRIVAQLLVSMDSLAIEGPDAKPVIVIAATNRPDSLDPALRRGGRFDQEINMGVPNETMRKEILRAQTRQVKLSPDVDFDILARMTPGFVGADLNDLVSRAEKWALGNYRDALEAQAASLETAMDTDCQSSSAVLTSIRRLQQRFKATDMPEPSGYEDTSLPMESFLHVLPTVQPSSKREGFSTIPDTTWADIGALSDVREELHMAIVDPIQQPETYRAVGISAPSGVLLWGPPGCGKTLLAKAVANESKANFIAVKGPELLNKFVGESERAVRQVFTRARSSIPCVIFFDEIDALVPRRDDALSEASSRVVNTLLTELDGIGGREGIYIIAATNRPDVIDKALLRPGRIDMPLFVGLPGEKERIEILTALLLKTPIDVTHASFAASCDGFTGADLRNLVNRATRVAVKRRSKKVELWDFVQAKETISPSVGEKDMKKYMKLRDEFVMGS